MRQGPDGSGAIKRAIDVWVAIVGLVVLSPVFAVIAVSLLLVQGRPVLFRQRRPGRLAKPFPIVKFRTMRTPTADEIAHQTDDVRITGIGRILRRTSLDELPELWNVLRGEMSIVGPRPLLMEYLPTYTDRQMTRHDVRPGITSWAAVNGRHSLRFEGRLELDIWYVEHRSLRLDARIVVMTLAQVLKRTDVSDTQDVGEIGFPLSTTVVDTEERDDRALD